MTEEERRALPWYGGNKIPDSYLKRFLPSQGRKEETDMSVELRSFLASLGASDPVPTSVDVDGLL